MTNRSETVARKADRRIETPIETAARLRREFGISLNEPAHKPLPQSVFDDMSGEK
jgi:antitoxin VapB